MKTTLLSLLILICSMAVCLSTSFAQDPRPMVRLIYLLPNDRKPQPEIDAKMDELIKDVQQFYANQMEAHGFGRKTFRIETDATGKAVVHHVRGQFADVHYHIFDNISFSRPGGIGVEIDEQFKLSRNCYLVVLEISAEYFLGAKGPHACGAATNLGDVGGVAYIPASGPCFGPNVAAHEIGHVFGLLHDPQNDSDVMASSGASVHIDDQVLSYCAAEWLAVHRAFNPAQPVFDDEAPTTEMLPPSFASDPNAIRLRFKVSDPDGLYQAQVIAGNSLFLGCKQVNGNTRSTFEIVTTHLPRQTTPVSLQFIDMRGHISYGESYSINVPDLLPPAKVVTIPDAKLAAAVREALELTPGTALTTYTMLDLRDLQASKSGIRDLTGLEHAHNLRNLNLWGNNISDVSSLAGLTQLTELRLDGNNISDVSSLAGLTQLTELQLDSNNISDVSSFAGLTQLTILYLWGNNISDVSSLAGLTQLTELQLDSNNISDVSSFAGLTQLTELNLSANNVSDVSSFVGLTQLTELNLHGNNISDISPLSGLTQLKILSVQANKISDVSPVVGLNLTGTARNNTGLSIHRNPLSYASIKTHIPAMQAKGIDVSFSNRTHSALSKISGDTQEGAAGAALTTPFVVEAMDESGIPMQGMSVTFAVTAGGGRLSTTTTTTDITGRARTTLTLGQSPGRNAVRATAEGILSFAIFNATVPQEPTRLAADVNGDGAVNIQDMVLVASRLGQAGQNEADVNEDGVVNIQDLVLVAGELGTDAAAPSVWHRTSVGVPTRAIVEQWLTQAHRLPLTDVRSQRGILLLERLLATLTPKETALLTNYPNPFNPETWIPYQLAKPTEVTLHIHSVKGELIRTLALGHQATGMYHSKSRAVYWDGRNEQGERVASGVYFYTFTAGDFTATRKLLIRK